MIKKFLESQKFNKITKVVLLGNLNLLTQIMLLLIGG